MAALKFFLVACLLVAGAFAGEEKVRQKKDILIRTGLYDYPAAAVVLPTYQYSIPAYYRTNIHGFHYNSFY
ncbi:Hypothetical protein NTJ_08223 [Nesidiocoris tenuis]|uniref:Uncharacterized protein n=1 Tax=Nesidiocoris tenuis TaxID=355587 RepID=A0ABN7AT77_9HEMI|nr:Hypothetical protein NTJ_08223 [Nesidiocoris tenuis]